MRLIDADVLNEQIKRCCCEPCEAEKRDYNHVRCRACEAGDMLDWIDDAHTFQPEVRRGKWGNYEPYLDGYRCSVCKSTHRNCTAFCPNCGTKMSED